MLTACADQLEYNLNLIKLCSACAKQNTAAAMLVQRQQFRYYSMPRPEFIYC